jgi:CheY-like chemotaxis protein
LSTPYRGIEIRVAIDFFGAVVGGSVFVLFVDDDAEFANAAARCFESIGMRTVVAFGTMPALDVSDCRDIDVIVTDVKLPAGEADRSALASMIRDRRPQVPIIMLIAHPEAHDVASPCIARCKPSEIAELCRAIRVRQTH